MDFVSLDLPADIVNQAKEQAGARGLGSWEDYARGLLATALEQQGETEVCEDYGAPAHLTFHSDEELKQMLLEGINSGPAVAMTDADWEAKRARIIAKYGQAKGE